MKLILTYPCKRMIYLKPQTKDEYLEMYERLLQATIDKDMTAIKVLVNQLIPHDVEEMKEE